MSSDQSPNIPDQGDRREAVREKAQQVRARQSRARTVRRVSITTAVVAVVAVVAVAVTWTVTSAASKPELSPAHVTDGGFEVTAVKGTVGPGATASPAASPSASSATAGKKASSTPSPSVSASASPHPGAVDIRVYVDYLAPGAAQFQAANATQLAKWMTQDAASLTYYPVAMLTPKSNGTKYSLRAASAAACVATYSSEAFFAYNNALLTRQPDQGSDGLTDQQLADLAVASGVQAPKTVRSCIQGEDYASWVKSTTDKALAGLPDTKDVALTSAPMILVNGQPYVGALDDPKEFAQFVLTIASDSYYSSASPSPTPTPTATTSQE